MAGSEAGHGEYEKIVADQRLTYFNTCFCPTSAT